MEAYVSGWAATCPIELLPTVPAPARLLMLVSVVKLPVPSHAPDSEGAASDAVLKLLPTLSISDRTVSRYKKMDIWSVPELLTIQLKGFRFGQGQRKPVLHSYQCSGRG